MTSAMMSMQATSTRMRWPYSVKISRPEVLTEAYTRPRMPKGARLMTQRTAFDTASEIAVNTSLVRSPEALRAMPSTTAQARMPT